MYETAVFWGFFLLLTHHREEADEEREGADHGENGVLHHGGDARPNLRAFLRPLSLGVGFSSPHPDSASGSTTIATTC